MPRGRRSTQHASPIPHFALALLILASLTDVVHSVPTTSKWDAGWVTNPADLAADLDGCRDVLYNKGESRRHPILSPPPARPLPPYPSSLIRRAAPGHHVPRFAGGGHLRDLFDRR